MMRSKDLSNVMRRAWQMARATGKAFSVALSKSWALYRLVKQMRAGVVRFTYEKVNGTLRKARGTLIDTGLLVKGSGRADDGRTVKYYDVDAAGWRSFKIENFITMF